MTNSIIGMSRTTISLSPVLYQYMLDVSLREPDVLRRLREETASHPKSKMQIAPDQGQFMALLTRLMGAKRIIEVGVFTGYSSLAIALALPDDGHMVACDVSEEYTATARRYWQEACVADLIDLRIAPAVETLEHLLQRGQADTYDMIFVDADKESYDLYYELSLRLLRPGGLILLDNVLRDGAVADPSSNSAATRSVQHLNAKLHKDARVHITMVPIGDGLTLALKV